jgi:thioredoxin 1
MVSVIDEKTFAEKIRSNLATNNPRPLVVDCFTDWCPPCKVSAPIYESLSKKYSGADFVKINVDNNPGVAHKLDVQGIPTFAILRGNKLIAKIVGADMRKVEKKIKEALENS